jgi:DNA-binding response OmpR family regulator
MMTGSHKIISVLVVDDEPQVLALFGDALGQNGFRVTAVDSFLSAFEAIHNNRFELLILDKVDGYVQVLQRFRALMANAPVLLISGSPDNTDDQALMAGQLDRVIQKPVGLVALLAHVYACLPKAEPGKQG